MHSSIYLCIQSPFTDATSLEMLVGPLICDSERISTWGLAIASLCTSAVLSKTLLDNDGEAMPLRATKSELKMGERAPLKPATHLFSALDGALSPCASCWLLACLLLPPAYSHKPPAPPAPTSRRGRLGRTKRESSMKKRIQFLSGGRYGP